MNNDINSITALLIEGNDDDASKIENILQKYHNVTVIRKKTLEDGIDTLKSNIFDIILMDLNLPDSNGIESLRSIHQVTNVERNPNFHIPVLVVTEISDVKTCLEALKCGAQDWMIKGELNGNLHRAITFSIMRHVSKRKSEKDLCRYIEQEFGKVMSEIRV